MTPQPASGGADATRADATIEQLRDEALAWARTPRRFGTLAVTEHLVRAMRAYGWTLVVGGFTQPLLYLLGLAVGLAALIQAPIDDGSGPVPYLVFVAPALLMTAAVTVAAEEFGYPVFAGFKWRRFYHGFAASPIRPGQIADGVVLAVVARMLLTVVLYLGFVLIFFAVLQPDSTRWSTAWLAVPIALLGGTAFGAPLLAYTATLQDDTGQLPMMYRLVLMPMFLFSGTFYPLASIGALQWIGWISPLWHASELGRAAMYGKPMDAATAVMHLAVLAGFTTIGMVLARRQFARRLAR